MLVTGARNMKIVNWSDLKYYLNIMVDDENIWRFDEEDKDWFSNNPTTKEIALSQAKYIDFTNLKLFISDERNSEIETWENMVRQVCKDNEVDALLFSINVQEMRFYILYNSEKNLFENDDEITGEFKTFDENQNCLMDDPNEIF